MKPNEINTTVRKAFVYGTLRKGGRNHHWVKDFIDKSYPATLQQEQQPQKGNNGLIRMYHYGNKYPGANESDSFQFPYLTEEDEKETRNTIHDSNNKKNNGNVVPTPIVGEILSFKDWDAALASMDELEQSPDFYYRCVKTVQVKIPKQKIRSNDTAFEINNEYDREQQQQQHEEDDFTIEEHQAWVYFMQPSQQCPGKLISSGDWLQEICSKKMIK